MKEADYDGIQPDWRDRTSDMVPVRAWNRLKARLDAVGLRQEYEAEYRRQRDDLAEKFGLPLRASTAVIGYEREVLLFKNWHRRAWGSDPKRWPWEFTDEQHAWLAKQPEVT